MKWKILFILWYPDKIPEKELKWIKKIWCDYIPVIMIVLVLYYPLTYYLYSPWGIPFLR